MKKPNLPDLTFEVFEDELAENIPQFLSEGELSYRVNGIYHRLGLKLKEPVYPNQIKNAMSRVKKIAAKKGYTFSTLREKQLEGTKSKSNKVVGWRLGTEFDKTYIVEDVHVRQNIRDDIDGSIERDLNTAQAKGLLQPEDVKNLRSGNYEALGSGDETPPTD